MMMCDADLMRAVTITFQARYGFDLHGHLRMQDEIALRTHPGGRKLTPPKYAPIT